MFSSRKSNNLINKAQERALRLTCKDNENNFQTLLNENNEASVTKETCNFSWRKFIKSKTTTVHPLCTIFIQFRENTFKLRHFREITTHDKKTSNHGLETVSYRAPFLWAKLPSEHKTQHL